MGPRGFWIALSIVLFYLIARPRIGTVWYVNSDGAVNPLLAPSPTNWFDASPPAPTVRPDAPKGTFADRRDCLNAAGQYEREAGLVGVYCASKNAFVWGVVAGASG
jgi:hypothetical protein